MAIDYSFNALTDLETIEDYLARRSGDAALARRFIERLEKSLEMLEVFPTKGLPRDDLSPDIRQHVYKSYPVLYSVTETEVLIQAVIEGHRDVGNLFKR